MVDDSLLTSRVVSDFLIENGYRTEIISTGEAAVRRACSGNPLDLIIMDIELAGDLNGIEAACAILNCVDIPIVFLTAHSSKEILAKLKEIHAYGFVLKGMDKYALLSTVEMAFNLYEANARTKAFNLELKQAQRELEASQKQYLELTEYAPVGILKCDREGKIHFVNQKALEILGSPSAEETKGINLLRFPPLVQYGLSAKLAQCIQENILGIHEMNYVSKWGKQIWMRLHMKPITQQDAVIGVQIILDDVTEKKQLEEELRLLSFTDPLTGVYNRRYFIQKLEDEIARMQRQCSGSFCIAMLDVDHFKLINDCFGHDSGDLVLKQLTKTVKRRLRKVDCFARWGGEEFILLMPNTKIHEAVLLMEELRKSIGNMESPIHNHISASFGVVSYRDGDSVDSMIHRADHLMYSAKKTGRNCVKS